MTETVTSIPADFSLSGHLLIAMPSMLDPRFSGSVVYLCEHSSKGGLGLIINRPSEMNVQTLLQKIDLDVQRMLPPPFIDPTLMSGVAGHA